MNNKICPDCGIIIRYRSERCRSCASKVQMSISKNNPNYKHGNTLIVSRCVDCGKMLHKHAFYYNHKRCKSCAMSKQRKQFLINPKNNPFWNGGASFEEYGEDFDSALKEQVRFRDKYKCRKCGCTQLENGKQLDVHHIDYDKKNNIITNLISLCRRCHLKTNHNRDYWYAFFKFIMDGIYDNYSHSI